MNRPEYALQPFKFLRTFAATAMAIVSGALTMATGRGRRGSVTLQPGDAAPDFELTGSDGRIYRLGDLVADGHAAVIAWFPKAFTGG
jgi:hypothetical protein